MRHVGSMTPPPMSRRSAWHRPCPLAAARIGILGGAGRMRIAFPPGAYARSRERGALMNRLAVLALVTLLPAQVQAGLGQQCKTLCGEQVGVCVGTHPEWKRRAKRLCRGLVRRRCKTDGLAVCLPTTTTTSTTSTTTSTTLPLVLTIYDVQQ